MPRSGMRSPRAKVSSNSRLAKIISLAVRPLRDEKLFGVGTGMGLRKDDTELREALNKSFRRDA